MTQLPELPETPDQYAGPKVPATYHPNSRLVPGLPPELEITFSDADKIEECRDADCPDGKPYPNMRPNNALNPRAVHYHTPEGIWYPSFLKEPS